MTRRASPIPRSKPEELAIRPEDRMERCWSQGAPDLMRIADVTHAHTNVGSAYTSFLHTAFAHRRPSHRRCANVRTTVRCAHATSAALEDGYRHVELACMAVAFSGVGTSPKRRGRFRSGTRNTRVQVRGIAGSHHAAMVRLVMRDEP